MSDTIDRIQYLKKAVKAGACYYKTWLIDSMAIVVYQEPPNLKEYHYVANPGLRGDEPSRWEHEEHPYQLFNYNDQPAYLDPTTHKWTVVSGYIPGKPLFSFKEEVTLEPGDLANVDTQLTTWVGNVLVNQCVLCYPFGDFIPFQRGTFSIASIERIIASKLASIPDDGTPRDDAHIYVDILEKYYYDAAFSLSGWTQLAVPSATPYTLVTDPAIRKRRMELLQQHKDELDDPTVVAKIMEELIKMDKDFQANDPEAGYLQPGKSFDVVRAKALLMYGLERDAQTGKYILIDRPLSEGWDLNALPHMVNTIINGSFSRGTMTALGGEAAKFIGRFFLSTRISEDDCGVTYGRPVFIPGNGKDSYLGATIVAPGGKGVLITEENFAKYAGTMQEIYSPQYCKAKEANFCVKCIGQRFRDKPDSLGNEAMDIGAVILNIMLKKFHGTALKTHKWDWRNTAE